ncbi:MAG: serine hydrolase domain-containing protein [Ginsengibacter sp.]
MNKYIKKISSPLLLLFFCFQSYFSFGQTSQKYSKEVETKITEVVNHLRGWVQIENEPLKWTLADRMKFYHVNGVSIAVIKNYKIEWARGFGWADSAEQHPVATATLFQAGSISKSLNAVGILKLVQEGKLSLDSDINDYLKSWKFPYDSLSKGKKITLSNLLSHTAGLNVHGFFGYEKGDTIPSLVQVLNGEKPANSKAVHSMFEPSLKYEYSGGGIEISQLIAQDITGQPYDVYMWQNVLKPMGLTHSFYTQPPPTDKLGLLATGYYNDGKEVKGKYHIYPEQAAAGLWTNPTDLAHFVIETQLSLQGKSNKVLSQKMTKRMLTPYIDSSAALGVFITKQGNDKYFSHEGTDEGFVSRYYGSIENGNGVVVMANTYNTGIFDEIINSIATVYNWKGFYVPKIKKVVTVSNEILKSYVGKYKLNTDTLIVTLENKNLMIRFNQKEKYKAWFTSNSDFFMIAAFNSEQKFTRDSQNKVDGFHINSNGYKMNALKIE